MPYILNKTNGSVLTTLVDATIDQTTDLKLVGRNYVGYGEIVNENLIKLLENFSNKTAPSKPLTGQVWYDVLTKTLKVYDAKFRNLTFTEVSTTPPTGYSNGHLWFNPESEKLYVKNSQNATGYSPIGPFVTTRKVLASDNQIFEVLTTSYEINNVNTVFEVVSNNSFTIKTPWAISDLYDNRPLIAAGFTTIKKGLTVSPEVNVSSITTKNITSGGASTVGTITGTWKLSSNSTLEATFADVAERYHADAVYEPGTVVVIGGVNDITVSPVRANTAVAGVISTAPAYKLNASAGKDATHPYVALKGRVPCKVLGNVRKGDQLVTAPLPGYAEIRTADDDASAVIGVALEDFTGYTGVIEVKV